MHRPTPRTELVFGVAAAERTPSCYESSIKVAQVGQGGFSVNSGKPSRAHQQQVGPQHDEKREMERWVDPLGLHFAKALVVELALMIALFAGCRLVQPWD